MNTVSCTQWCHDQQHYDIVLMDWLKSSLKDGLNVQGACGLECVNKNELWAHIGEGESEEVVIINTQTLCTIHADLKGKVAPLFKN